MADRFKKKGKKWYNWSDAQAQKQWDAVRDSKVPRCTDAFGNLCLAKLDARVLTAGVNVGTRRSVAQDTTHEVDGNDPQEMQKIKDGVRLSIKQTY